MTVLQHAASLPPGPSLLSLPVQLSASCQAARRCTGHPRLCGHLPAPDQFQHAAFRRSQASVLAGACAGTCLV